MEEATRDAPVARTAAEEALVWARTVAAGLCLFSGLIHLLYAPAHFEVGADAGLFFVVVGLDQLAAGLLLLTGLFLVPVAGLTLLGTLGVIGLYVASRTTGLPFGPHPDEAETTGLLDLLTALFEAMVVALLAVVLVGTIGDSGPPGSRPDEV